MNVYDQGYSDGFSVFQQKIPLVPSDKIKYMRGWNDGYWSYNTNKDFEASVEPIYLEPKTVNEAPEHPEIQEYKIKRGRGRPRKL
jgi:hypothetical protein